MNRIYLDHASTSFPKAPGVAQAMMDYLTLNGANVNRGCYSSAYSAEEVIYETRQLLAQLFHFPKCKNVIFTPNITTSLNFILKGLLKPGDHILVSAMEHNAVMRPVVQLTSHGNYFRSYSLQRRRLYDPGTGGTFDPPPTPEPSSPFILPMFAEPACPWQNLGKFAGSITFFSL